MAESYEVRQGGEYVSDKRGRQSKTGRDDGQCEVRRVHHTHQGEYHFVVPYLDNACQKGLRSLCNEIHLRGGFF